MAQFTGGTGGNGLIMSHNYNNKINYCKKCNYCNEYIIAKKIYSNE